MERDQRHDQPEGHRDEPPDAPGHPGYVLSGGVAGACTEDPGSRGLGEVVSSHLVAPGTIHACAMCPAETYAAWGELAKAGWWSKYIGGGIEALKLCPSCKDIIDVRREAAALLAGTPSVAPS